MPPEGLTSLTTPSTERWRDVPGVWTLPVISIFTPPVFINSERSRLNHIPVVTQSRLEPSNFLVLVLVSMAFVAMVLGLSGALFCVRRCSGPELKEKLVGMATDPGNDATATYQDLCRQRMAERSSEVFHHTTHTSRINSVSSQFSDGAMQIIWSSLTPPDELHTSGDLSELTAVNGLILVQSFKGERKAEQSAVWPHLE
ncbi:hypothetical protein AMELA_G00057970 [Ameiurus melas]|uniref:Uncharacterized protein n=1 Tax=Ameiurus melas TaxID=219545 RepID=A0A7J6B0T9_AMEME|nr:hypothetical protein AMELA_G00057970 [Ameiurus melas]